MKKEILERIILLNDKTDAFAESPHPIAENEIQESLKSLQKKFRYYLVPLFLIMIFLSVYIFIAHSFNLPFINNGIFKIIPFLTILKAFNLSNQNTKIELMKEQLFLVALL